MPLFEFHFELRERMFCLTPTQTQNSTLCTFAAYWACSCTRQRSPRGRPRRPRG